jgi:hypothetical protein
LHAWADSLQNSKIAGQRYLTDKTRRRDKSRQEREEFIAGLDEIRRASGKPEE